MSMKSLAIKDFAEVITGGTPSTSIAEYWNGDIPWLNSGELNKGIIFNASNFITKKGLSKSNAKLMPIDTVLIALTGTTTGATALLKIEACANQSVTGILPSVSHVPKYLYFYLRSIRKEIMDKSYGGAQKHISQQFVKDIQVPLPSIEEQHRIVKILDLAQSLIEKRKKAIAYLDDYIKAVFLDMFGDPVSNPKGWEVVKFANFGTLDRGKSKHRPRNAPELLGGEHPLIQTGDIANSKLFIENYVSTYSDIGLKQSKKWPKGTLCITIAANIAKTGILAFDACFPDSVVGFVANPSKTNSIFIHYWMSFFQKILEDNAPESAQKNINLKILRDLGVINPPKEVQDKFAVTVQEIVSVKQKMQSQLKELEDNFQVQMQRAFKGE